MKRIVVLIVGLLLSGCSGTFSGLLTNHVVVTLDDGKCMTASRWGPIAITGDIGGSECAAIVSGRRALLIYLMTQRTGGGS